MSTSSHMPITTKGPIDLEKGTQIGHLNGKEVLLIPPPSYGLGPVGQLVAAISSVSSSTLILMGSIMWGVCANHPCSPGTETAGVVLTSIGVAGLGLTCCIGATVLCFMWAGSR